MVELNFDMVSWTLLLSIFLAKAILFISVFAIAVFVLRRKGIGKGGLYGIFVTQSNDFAIGYPIGTFCNFLYDKTELNYFSLVVISQSQPYLLNQKPDFVTFYCVIIMSLPIFFETLHRFLEN